MSTTELLQRVKALLAEAFGPRLKGVVLYGSRARGDAEWVIREDSMPPERFSLIADESLKRIQATGQAR